MKSFAALFLMIAFIATTLANIAPTPPSHCDFKCNPADGPIYATNGKCFLQMQGKCKMETYNCLNPHKTFREVSKLQYSADTAPKCQTKDY